MGHYKQEQISQQAEIDRLVAWYRFHRDILPESYMQMLLENDDLLEKSIQAWERVPFAPKPAGSHVALQSRDYIRAERASVRLERKQRWALVGWLLVVASIVTGMTILILEVLR